LCVCVCMCVCDCGCVCFLCVCHRSCRPCESHFGVHVPLPQVSMCHLQWLPCVTHSGVRVSPVRPRCPCVTPIRCPCPSPWDAHLSFPIAYSVHVPHLASMSHPFSRPCFTSYGGRIMTHDVQSMTRADVGNERRTKVRDIRIVDRSSRGADIDTGRNSCPAAHGPWPTSSGCRK
jgi:hypothetical protein